MGSFRVSIASHWLSVLCDDVMAINDIKHSGWSFFASHLDDVQRTRFGE